MYVLEAFFCGFNNVVKYVMNFIKLCKKSEITKEILSFNLKYENGHKMIISQCLLCIDQVLYVVMYFLSIILCLICSKM